MSYLDPIFLDNIDKESIKIIFELGSRDLVDARKLHEYYGAVVYAFECNPDCLEACKKTAAEFTPKQAENIHLIENAVSLENGPITFYPFDLTKYDNMGSSSLLKIDFSNRADTDPDAGRENPQKSVTVEGSRLDTFCEKTGLTPELLCMDLQGYELCALQSMGERLKSVKYIISEATIRSTYVGGANFWNIHIFLNELGFQYVCNNNTYKFPDINATGFMEFDVLYERLC
jgi:FkbM family methyltransferase